VFYLYNRLISLNEVGAAPDLFGLSASQLHGWLAERRAKWPHALSTTATHDTKRGEDVRARINVLSELPRPWKQALSWWSRLNRKHRRDVDGLEAPSRNEEYLLYQTLVGALPFGQVEWPAFRERIEHYLVGAARGQSPFELDRARGQLRAGGHRVRARDPGSVALEQIPEGLPVVSAPHRSLRHLQQPRTDRVEAGGARRA
jgi:hypothetical protein